METPLEGVRVVLDRMISFLLAVSSFSFLENRRHREVGAESRGFQCL
jgi:hypothetical protein